MNDWLFESCLIPKKKIELLSREIERSGIFSDLDPKFIDSGCEKDAFDLGNRVLLLYKDNICRNEQYKTFKLYKDKKFWKYLEPQIFELGEIDIDNGDTYYFSIMEKFITVPYDLDDFFEELCWHFNYKFEHKVEDCVDFTNLPQLHLFHLQSDARRQVNRDKEYLISKYSDAFEEANKLINNDDWLYQLAENIIFKVSTDRWSDLHSGNLGFRLTDRRPVFFDW